MRFSQQTLALDPHIRMAKELTTFEKLVSKTHSEQLTWKIIFAVLIQFLRHVSKINIHYNFGVMITTNHLKKVAELAGKGEYIWLVRHKRQ